MTEQAFKQGEELLKSLSSARMKLSSLESFRGQSLFIVTESLRGGVQLDGVASTIIVRNEIEKTRKYIANLEYRFSQL